MYVLRTRLASFVAGFASAAALGFYFVQSEIYNGNHAIFAQVNKSFKDLEYRISRLESSSHLSVGESSEQIKLGIDEAENLPSVAAADS
ncbi:hypothetical protein KP509_02G074200 [Ceratopteris richardii]|uniref:Uncharacterized protein n=1 Tax=Ceratopteris richardii TaxID=49495 RepID=A0A8T2VED2_CERRI|nr:hypothetical protein KP509_02G074200 [Ceratopteris richardii]